MGLPLLGTEPGVLPDVVADYLGEANVERVVCDDLTHHGLSDEFERSHYELVSCCHHHIASTRFYDDWRSYDGRDGDTDSHEWGNHIEHKTVTFWVWCERASDEEPPKAMTFVPRCRRMSL